MVEYNYNDNRLVVESKTGIKYDLVLRGRITVVRGESGSGKTYLVSTVRDFIYSPLEDIRNIFVVTCLDELRMIEDSNSLIIMDRGDIVVNTDIRDYIRGTSNLHYLIFARSNLGLVYSPNYIGTLKKDGSLIELDYKYNIKGWFE